MLAGESLYNFVIWVVTAIYTVFKGYGGGFNERENVEYIEREESDGEYDEVSSQWICTF